MLKALRPVLYLAHQYSVGESLPVNDPEMVDIWIEAGTAVWEEDAEAAAPKAIPASALDGMPGESSDGDADALIGRVPVTEERKAAKPRRKKA